MMKKTHSDYDKDMKIEIGCSEHRAYSRLALTQLETSLQSSVVSHWLESNEPIHLESALEH